MLFFLPISRKWWLQNAWNHLDIMCFPSRPSKLRIDEYSKTLLIRIIQCSYSLSLQKCTLPCGRGPWLFRCKFARAPLNSEQCLLKTRATMCPPLLTRSPPLVVGKTRAHIVASKQPASRTEKEAADMLLLFSKNYATTLHATLLLCTDRRMSKNLFFPLSYCPKDKLA